MSALEGLLIDLGVDLTDPSVELAVTNFRNERDLMDELRRTRESHRLTVHVVATRMGVSDETVRGIEGWDSDVTLARLRRYTHAVGATTKHTLTEVQAEPPC